MKYSSPLSVKLMLLLILVSMSGCGKQKDSGIGEMAELCELATVEYKLTKIVMSTRSSFWGTKKILFQVYATIKAGIDMKDFSEKDVVIAKDSITIHLPKAKIVGMIIKPEDIVLKYHEQTGVAFRFDEKEINEILRIGESDIRKTIESNTDLLRTAGENAKIFIETLLNGMNFGKKITVAFR
jgi:hypothetical protein